MEELFINDLRPYISCNDLEISFDYYDLTDKLCDITKNSTANLLQVHLQKYYKKFNINNFYKLNPSIVKLSDTKLLMCYRLYMGELGCDKFTMDECHPWKRMWASSIFEYETPITKLNYVGLSRINLSTMEIEEDIVLGIDDEPTGMEDVRLFEENGNFYLSGAITVGNLEKGSGEWKDNRILRQAIVKLGSQNELIQKLSSNLKSVNLNCIEAHTSVMEKNWFGYKNNNKYIIVNPTFGKFFPLKQFNLELDNLIPLNENVKQLHYPKYKNMRAVKCNSIGQITDNNLIKLLNDTYRSLLKDDSKDLFRLSGGSWGVDISKDESLFIGHVVAYIDLLDNNKVINYIKSNSKSIISNNLYHLLFNRKYQLTFFGKTMRYFQMFFVINKNSNKLTKISHGFNIFENKDKESGVNFPIGLVKQNDDIFISFGESDYKTIIIKMKLSEVYKLLNITEIKDTKLLTYDKESKLICYNVDKDKFYLKYMKYKNKYLSLQSELSKV